MSLPEECSVLHQGGLASTSDFAWRPYPVNESHFVLECPARNRMDDRSGYSIGGLYLSAWRTGRLGFRFPLRDGFVLNAVVSSKTNDGLLLMAYTEIERWWKES